MAFVSDLRPARPPFAFQVARPLPIRLTPLPAAGEARRRKLWDLSPSLHCSIVGTCLTTGELRRLVAKATASGADARSDHDIHKTAVSLASKPVQGGKLLQKALETRHEAVVKRFDKATDGCDVRSLWKEALSKGEIPGAYWAVLTHSAASEELVREVFGDVHMLSHLVGAANRADIRRLADLEAANIALEEKVLRQQERLREAQTANRHEIDQLRRLLAEKSTPEPQSSAEPAGDEVRQLRSLAERLQRQFATETMRRQRAEAALDISRHDAVELTRRLTENDATGARLARELASVETFADASPADDDAVVASLAGMTLLYVGGRTHGVAQLQAAVTRYGGVLLHHDGGQQEAISLLPGLVARADHVYFPVDCISHEAALSLKRQCKQVEKGYTPLSSSGFGCFLQALPKTQSAATV